MIVHCLQLDEAVDNVRGSRHPPKSLDKLLHEIRDLRDPHRTSFEGLQRLTNLGVHVRLDGRTELAGEVKAVQEQVISVLTWLYDKSIARKHLAQQARRATVEEKLRGAEGHLSPHLQLANVERQLQEVAAECDAQLERVERAETRAATAEAERDKLKAERAKVVRAARQLRWARWRSRITGAVIVGGSLVAAASVWCILGPMLNLPSGAQVSGTATMLPASSADSAPSTDLATDDDGADGSDLQKALADASADPAAVDPSTLAAAAGLAPIEAPLTALGSPAAVTPTCPTGMVLVPATTIQIGQPTGRSTWPPPRPARIDPIDVPAFCIDRHPTRWADLSAPPRDAKKACSKPKSDLARCLTRDEAERACEARSLRLPRLVEWEALLRSPAEISLDGSPKEWVEDRFPPKVLNRFGPAPQGDGLYRMNDLRTRGAEEGDVWWSWNQQPPDPRYPRVGFRCAGEVGG